ncbi:hypothetical protein [Diaphorobacter aerolatus]|uniref:hypothetical protein n=1 Tax=Diaphorobacter aerolatus TaxID=1288495 RepID=UPI00299F5E91|nr:hypothetical protein [Diaphorobacter aerolatus]
MHGAGRLGQPLGAAVVPLTPRGLRDAALREDWQRWVAQWRELDAGAVADIERQVAAGGKARLTLCGECNALQYDVQERSFGQKLKGIFAKPPRFQDLQNQL